MGKGTKKRLVKEYKSVLKSKERYRWYCQIQTLLREGYTVIAACKAARVGRSEYYYWHRRIQELEHCRKPGTLLRPTMFLEVSRKPHHSPRQCPDHVVKRILDVRKKTNQGAEYIRFYLMKHHQLNVSVSGIYGVIKRAGLIKERTYHRKKKDTVIRRTYVPGEKVQVDTKYVKAANGTTYYQYGAIDLATGIIFKQLYKAIEPASSTAFLRSLVMYFPFPIQMIQTDNGLEYTWRLTPQVQKEHPFTTQCKLLGLQHVLIPPASPTFNSKIERTHRIDMEELWRNHPKTNFQTMQTALRRYVRNFNTKRPAASQNFRTPIQVAQQDFSVNTTQLRYPVQNVSN